MTEWCGKQPGLQANHRACANHSASIAGTEHVRASYLRPTDMPLSRHPRLGCNHTCPGWKKQQLWRGKGEIACENPNSVWTSRALNLNDFPFRIFRILTLSHHRHRRSISLQLSHALSSWCSPQRTTHRSQTFGRWCIIRFNSINHSIIVYQLTTINP